MAMPKRNYRMAYNVYKPKTITAEAVETVISKYDWDFAWSGDLADGTEIAPFAGEVVIPIENGGPDLNGSTSGLTESAIGDALVDKALVANATGDYRLTPSASIGALAPGLSDISARMIFRIPSDVTATSAMGRIQQDVGSYWDLLLQTNEVPLIRWRHGLGTAQSFSLTGLGKSTYVLLDWAFDADIDGVNARGYTFANGVDFTPADYARNATGWANNAGVSVLSTDTGSPATQGSWLFFGIQKGVLRTEAEHLEDAEELGLYTP